MIRIATATLLLCTALGAHAATVIDARSAEGETSRISLTQDSARIDSGGMDGYLLIRLDQGRMYSVMHSERMVLDITPDGQARPADTSAGQLTAQGAGPVVAGYPTIKYTLSAAGKTCQQLLLSGPAMQLPHVERFATVMRRFDLLDDGMTGPAGDMLSPCERAELAQQDAIAAHGMPLRVLDGDGRLLSEVSAIQLDVDVPAARFELPADYRHTSPRELMQQNEQGMREQRQIMEQEMEGLSPEQQQQMRELMRQMGE